jgi:hypothetical protein
LAHDLFWLVVNGKIQLGLRVGKTEKGFRRENAGAKTKTSGRAGIGTQLDMNALSFSGKPPVDR